MKKIIAVLAVLLVLTTGAAAKNFTIQDSSANPLFKVDGNTGEKQLKNGLVNISEGGEPIARFEQSGITFDQPLSLESPGALSVANGIDLTGSSSNTIESYSTFYLTTSSGSPSDIVLQPTGEVGVDSNLSTTGDIDLQGNALRGTGSLVDKNGNKCNANQFLNGNGVCETDTDTDTTLTEDEAEQFIFDTGDNDQGNLGLNGNEIVDTQGSVTLGGGNVDIPDGDLSVESSDKPTVKLDDSDSGNSAVLRQAGGSDELFQISARNSGMNLELHTGGLSSSSVGLSVDSNQNVDIPNGDLAVSGNTDGVDLDNPGNAITVNSNQYEVASGSIADNEIQDNTVDNSEVQNGDNFAFGNVDVASPSATGGQLDVGGGANFNGNINLNNGGGLDNVNDIEMDGNIYGAGVDMSLQEVGSVLGPKNGDTDLNIQTQGGGSHVVSIEDGSSSNADIAVFEEGSQNVRIPNGRLGINTADPQKDLDVNGDARIRGNLDVWGNITNTQVNNLNVNGSIVPPDGYDATFDVGSNSKRWRDAHFSGTVYASNFQDSSSGNSIEDTYVDEAGDTMTGNLNMGHNDINNVDQLTIPDSGDAGGKNLLQVGDDAYMTDIDDSNTLGIYGVQNNGVATIQLGQSGARISGDSNGNLNAGSSKIVNAADPTNAQDVATKSYVDNSDNTGTDDQTLGEVLNQGNTANQNIDMNGNSVTNAQSVSFNSDEEITGSGDLCLGDRCA